jgi:hypothetical protein
VSKKLASDTRAYITKDHQATYPDPLVVQAGDELVVGKQDTDWPAFIWCTNQAGKSGWVPEKHLDRQGQHAIARRDYSTAELTVTTGEQVNITSEDSGWYWVTNQAGHSGWVPVEKVHLEADHLKPTTLIWLMLTALFVISLVLTMISDWRLTGQKPNILFYAVIPLLDILGTAAITFGIARFLKHPLDFLPTLAVIAGASIVLQFTEIIEKSIYYYLWQYPTMLYFVFNFILWLSLVVYGFVRWAKLRWQTALTLAFIGFLGGLLVIGIISSLSGLITPGS